MTKKYAICLGIVWNPLSEEKEDSIKVFALGKPVFDTIEQAESQLAYFLATHPKDIATILPIYTADKK